MPSLAIAAYRLLFASALLWPVTLWHHRPALRAVAPRDWAKVGVAGFFLGLHFATWIASLSFTSVASAVVLVDTAPLFVALLAGLFLRERLGGWMWVGLAVALGGGVLIAVSDAGADFSLTGTALQGDLLALLGAAAVAVYMVVGRAVQARLPFLVYITLVYTGATLTLWGAFFLFGVPLVTYAPPAYLWLGLLALVPQLIGHSAYNYALKYLPSTYVSLTVLAEPVGSIALAMLFLQEFPAPLTLVGAGLILVGLVAATRRVT